MRPLRILAVAVLALAGPATADEIILNPSLPQEGQFLPITAHHDLGCPLVDTAVETFDQGVTFTFYETCDCFPGIYGEVQAQAILPPIHQGPLQASIRVQGLAGDVFCGPSEQIAVENVVVQASTEWRVEITQPTPGNAVATIDARCPYEWERPVRDGSNIYLFADPPPSGIECTEALSFREVVALGTLAPDDYALVLLSDFPWSPTHLYQQRFTVLAEATSSLLLAGRFEATAAWEIHGGAKGAGTARSLTADSGAFWFFSPSNLELTVKVLDGCAVNNHRWLMASGMTDVGVELTVVDVHDGAERKYSSPLGTPFAPILDTSAFACP